mmetsp:Transcript_31998/g.54577  ORF Transcript_31998/g.54577 Transcript_31998/m.54577 type:complete len:156 (-) Transcript_31998:767-1234(-)
MGLSVVRAAVGASVRPDVPRAEGDPLEDSDMSDAVGDSVTEEDALGASDTTDATGALVTDKVVGLSVSDAVGDSVTTAGADGEAVGDSVTLAGNDGEPVGEAVTTEVIVGDPVFSEAIGDSVTTVEVEVGSGVVVTSVGFGVELLVGEDVPDGNS